MDASAPSVEEFAEYCRVQAGLLLGSVETMSAEADDLLDDVDEGVAEVQSRLDRGGSDAEGPVGPPAPDSPGGVDADEIARREADLERQQALVEATATRIRLYQDLAAGYASLAEDLRSDVTDPGEALDRVVRFEADADAPAYFEDRETLAEVVAARDAGGE